jgi:hypothetical protein
MRRFVGLYAVKIPRDWMHKPVDRQESVCVSECPSPREDEFARKSSTVTEEAVMQALMNGGALGVLEGNDK